MASRLKGTILLLIIVILIALAFLCHIIALVTDYWIKSSSAEQEDFLNLGLWVACFHNFRHPHENPPTDYTGCYGLYSEKYVNIRDWLIPSWLIVCRILSIIALILMIIGIILFILLLICVVCKWLTCDAKSGLCERILLYTTPIMFFVAGVFLMMVVMVFADNAFRLQCRNFWVGLDDPYSNHLSFSWGFELAACILTFFSGGFLLWLVVLKGRDEI